MNRIQWNRTEQNRKTTVKGTHRDHPAQLPDCFRPDTQIAFINAKYGIVQSLLNTDRDGALPPLSPGRLFQCLTTLLVKRGKVPNVQSESLLVQL